MVIVTQTYGCGSFYKEHIYYTYNIKQDLIFSGKVVDTIVSHVNCKPSVYFIKNNDYHRFYGPAAESKPLRKDIDSREAGWWFNGKVFGFYNRGYSNLKFLKDLNKQWLL